MTWNFVYSTDYRKQKVKVKNIRTTILLLDKVKGIKSISACHCPYTKVKIELWYYTLHVVIFTRIVNASESNGMTESIKYFQYEKYILDTSQNVLILVVDTFMGVIDFRNSWIWEKLFCNIKWPI